MDEVPRGLVGIARVVERTGLDETTIRKAAAQGRIPGATKLLGAWRFDPELIEAWIAAGRPTPQTTAPEESCYLSRPAPKPDPRHQRAEATPSNPIPLVPIYMNAPWRGVSDLPAETPAKRPAGRRRVQTRRTALSVN